MKKLSALIICLLMIVTCGLAGCATFSINKVKYYNEVLAKVGNTNITRFEVLSAYNSYGNTYYVQQMGQSESKAIKSTLNLLIDRESLYQYALTENKYKPTANQVNSIIEEIYSSLDEQMKSYVTTAKKMLNIEIVETKTEEESSNTPYKKEDYLYSSSRRATLESKTTYYTDANKTTISSDVTDWFDVEYYIAYDIPEEEDYSAIIDSSYLEDYTKDGIIEAIQTKYFEEFHKYLVNTENIENVNAIYNKAVKLFAEDLIDYEYYLRDSNGKAYNKEIHDLINRYFERTFTSQIKSQYLENIRINYLENETLSVSSIMDEFDKQLTSSYAKYVNRPASYKTAMKDIGTKGDTILYHPTLSDGTEFGYFIHTLISFTDEQKTAIKNLNENDYYYESDYASIIASTKANVRGEDGLVADTQKTLNEIVAEYQAITKLSNYETKLNEFINFMFEYTGDTATLSAGMPYVVGTNDNSAMVEEFTNEAISLMETGVRGSMSEVDINDIDSFCITEYGIHFIFYVDPVNAYDFEYDNKNSVSINDLTKVINPLTGETYFDLLFDAVYPASSDEEVYTSNTGYSDYETMIIKDIQAVNKVVKYSTRIKATKTSL